MIEKKKRTSIKEHRGAHVPSQKNVPKMPSVKPPASKSVPKGNK